MRTEKVTVIKMVRAWERGEKGHIKWKKNRGQETKAREKRQWSGEKDMGERDMIKETKVMEKEKGNADRGHESRVRGAKAWNKI